VNDLFLDREEVGNAVVILLVKGEGLGYGGRRCDLVFLIETLEGELENNEAISEAGNLGEMLEVSLQYLLFPLQLL
jgi:hypothetical protein